MSKYFFNNTTRNLVVAMQTLFNHIVIKRYDDFGDVSKEITVPLKFGPMHKFYMQRMEDGTAKKYYVQLPTMALTITGLSFSSSRARSTKEKRHIINPTEYSSPNKFLSDLMPTPWDVSFTLHIRTESFMDWVQIIEQIIPFFSPSVYIRVKEFDTIDLERDIKVTLDSLTPDFMDEQDAESVRTINGTLDFTAEAWFYKPMLNDVDIIKSVSSSYGFDKTSIEFDRENNTSYSHDVYTTTAMTKENSDLIPISGSITKKEIDMNNIVGVNYEMENWVSVNENKNK